MYSRYIRNTRHHYMCFIVCSPSVTHLTKHTVIKETKYVQTVNICSNLYLQAYSLSSMLDFTTTTRTSMEVYIHQDTIIYLYTLSCIEYVSPLCLCRCGSWVDCIMLLWNQLNQSQFHIHHGFGDHGPPLIAILCLSNRSSIVNSHPVSDVAEPSVPWSSSSPLAVNCTL